LSADEGALHDTVIAVIDAANEIGVQKIRMVADSKD
jgi:biopolymer transport protein ExbD